MRSDIEQEYHRLAAVTENPSSADEGAPSRGTATTASGEGAEKQGKQEEQEKPDPLMDKLMDMVVGTEEGEGPEGASTSGATGVVGPGGAYLAAIGSMGRRAGAPPGRTLHVSAGHQGAGERDWAQP